MFGNKACGGRALRIAIVIAALVLLMAGGAGAVTLTVNNSEMANYTKIQTAITTEFGRLTIFATTTGGAPLDARVEVKDPVTGNLVTDSCYPYYSGGCSAGGIGSDGTVSYDLAPGTYKVVIDSDGTSITYEPLPNLISNLKIAKNVS